MNNGRLNSELREAKKVIILKILEETDWNFSAAARIAGRSRCSFYKLATSLGISRPAEYRRYSNRGNQAWQELAQ